MYYNLSPSMVCDYPGCGNPISARCNLCGRSMCVRHIQYIGTHGADGFYISGHYECNFCAYQMLQQRRKWGQITAWLALVAILSCGVGCVATALLPPFGVLLIFVGTGTGVAALVTASIAQTR